MTHATERAGTRPAESMVTYGKRAFERGRRVGAAWAANTADYVELKRLAAIAVYLPLNDGLAGYRVISAILGEQSLTGPGMAEFFESIGIGDHDDPEVESGDYWEGFVESVLEVFENVEF